VLVFASGRAALLSITPNVKPQLHDFIKGQTLFASFYPGQSEHLVTAGDDGSIRHWQITGDHIKEIASQRVPETAIDWISLAEDGDEMLAVGSNRVLYVLDRRDGRILTAMGESESVDWAAARAVAMPLVNVPPDRAPSSATIAYPDAALKVVRTLRAGDRDWVVTEQPRQLSSDYTTYVVDGGRAATYPGLDMDVAAIEQHGDLLWLKGGGIWSNSGGPLVRLDGKDMLFHPRRDTVVSAIVPYQGKHVLATNRGLHILDGKNVMRVTKDNVAIRDLHLAGDQLWIATDQGAFVLSKDRLIRVTERFVDVQKVKHVGGRVWLLTKSADMSVPSGPAHLIENYFDRALPGSKARVTNVVEARGKTWLLASPGLYVFDGQRAIEVGPIPQWVFDLQEDRERLIVKTTTMFDGLGPTYEIDPDTLKAHELAR
jgi:hypothetical protein